MSKAEDVLQAKLQKLSPAQRDILLKKLQQQQAAKAKLSTSLRDKPIAKVARTQKNYPLSYSQQRLWFLEQLEQHAAYNIAASFELNGPLHVAALSQSFKLVIQRHESLRTVFVETRNGPRQEIIDRLHFELVAENLQQKPELLDSLIQQHSNQHFDLENGPLFKIKLWQLAADKHVLSIAMHHIISDAWSANIMMQEISSIYSTLRKGVSAVLPQPALQYIDYSQWQHDYLAEISTSQQAFWQQELAEFSNLQLQTDKPRPAANIGHGSFSRTLIDKPKSDDFAALCLAQGCSSFHGFLALYQVLLGRYSQQNDFCIGIPVAGRQHSDTENLLGFFVNSLAIRADVNCDISFIELLQRVKTRSLNALAHQDLPFEKLLELIQIERNATINPIFQTFFSYDQGTTEQALQLPGISSRYLPSDLQASKFDISLTLKDQHDGVSCHFEFNSALYCQQTIDQLAAHFSLLLQQVCSHSNTALGNLDFLSINEKQQLTDLQQGFNATEKSFAHYASLQQMFEEQVKKTPHATAVSDPLQSLSYEQLNLLSNQLAHRLINAGLNHQAIAVCLERSCLMSVALLAVLKSGAAYIPLLSDLPSKRLQYILDDTQTCCIISSSDLKEPLDAGEHIQNIYLDTIDDISGPAHNPDIAIDDTALFNIIYTSGSTGLPKGVMVPHSGIINRLQWMQEQYPLSSEDKVLQKTPFNFDVSVWELFWPLLNGAELFFAPAQMHKDPSYIRNCIIEKRISVCHFVPSMLDIFLKVDAIEDCHSLRHVFASGEALLRNQVDTFKLRLSHAKLHNLYGPTEASIDVSYFDCSQAISSSSVPIGKAIANCQLYILDQQAKLLPIGAVGELYIGGKGLALGYLNQPELSQASFIDNPFYQAEHAASSKKLYKSGDICRYLADGNIEYLGRSDQQVKIRGLRIELGEIEYNLEQHASIAKAVVSSQKINGQDLVVAFVQLRSEQILDSDAIRLHLSLSLPDYMQPTQFVSLESIPLSSNGKIDRKQLPLLGVSDLKQQEFIAPRNPIEQELAIIWQDLLGSESLGVLDNFFELGGHSLLATQMLMRIKEKFAIELPLRTLFEVSTIEGIAKLIAAILPDNNSANAENDDEEGFEEGIL